VVGSRLEAAIGAEKKYGDTDCRIAATAHREVGYAVANEIAGSDFDAVDGAIAVSKESR